MELYVFEEKGEKLFQRVKLNVVVFQNTYLIVKLKKQKIKMELAEMSLYNLFELLTADQLHVCFRQNNLTELYPMAYVVGISKFKIGLEDEFEQQVALLQGSYEARSRKVSELIDFFIESSSTKSIENSSLIAEAFILSMNDPGLLSILRSTLVTKSRRIDP